MTLMATPLADCLRTARRLTVFLDHFQYLQGLQSRLAYENPYGSQKDIPENIRNVHLPQEGSGEWPQRGSRHP